MEETSERDAIPLRLRPAGRVIVFDPQGRIVHDGSGDIPAYGQPMTDPFAFEVIAARSPHTQSSDRIVDIASDKDMTTRLLASAGLPVPKQELVQSEEGARRVTASGGRDAGFSTDTPLERMLMANGVVAVQRFGRGRSMVFAGEASWLRRTPGCRPWRRRRPPRLRAPP